MVEADESLVVEAEPPALAARVGAEVEHDPHERPPDARIGGDAPVVLVVYACRPPFGVERRDRRVARVGRLELPGRRARAVFGYAYRLERRILRQRLFHRLAHLVRLGTVPSRIEVEADRLRNGVELLLLRLERCKGGRARRVRLPHERVEVAFKRRCRDVLLFAAHELYLVRRAPQEDGRMVAVLGHDLRRESHRVLAVCGRRRHDVHVRHLDPRKQAKSVAPVVDVGRVRIVRRADAVRA